MSQRNRQRVNDAAALAGVSVNRYCCRVLADAADAVLPPASPSAQQNGRPLFDVFDNAPAADCGPVAL
jgi:hypothetical protein